ncbi:deoxynucleoside triphosphate triphosphohydrolase SAMHD1-like [Ischnura elegans]|uniref:deoxynucleoside triphosphate triphosphohydrolase SAMHD1-like n=1 Tax=Ischnura elegans TaxID=197161 RepID=UPI001ED89E8A|nr:deoxynucleoside triphosphate triphosphohydrolase SAMHD1-like [Ischnura elegans]
MMSSAKEMEFKVFNDSIHGHMELHPLCVKIIDTPEFQRLRNIKQLGVTYLVFPSASHNRFEHSLGVCYLAGEMVEALRKNQPDLNINEVDKLCVQIAGLCHDLGHGPFSHLWEAFLKQKGVVWHHEKQSVEMFNHLLEKNDLIGEFEKYGLHERERRFIKDLILGKGDSCDQGKQFLFQIVCNEENGIDVDKWDYFLRDGLHLNMNIIFDYRRILKFCRVNEICDEEGNKMLHIVFRGKEAYNLYEMFLVRSTLHYKAYQHRVVLLLDQMFVEAFMEADKHFTLKKLDGSGEIKLSEAHKYPETWTNLTDNIFYDIVGSHLNGLDNAKDICKKILSRKFHHFIVKSKYCFPEDVEEKKAKEELKKKAKEIEKKLDSKHSSRYLVLFSHIQFGGSCPDPFENIYFFSKENPSRSEKVDLKEIGLFPISLESARHAEFFLFDKNKDGKKEERDEAKSLFLRYLDNKN